jgi:predicted esterase
MWFYQRICMEIAIKKAAENGDILKDRSIGPKDGKAPAYVVIVCHAYGDSGGGAARAYGEGLSNLMPEAKFRFPYAQDRSWFEVDGMVKAEAGSKTMPSTSASLQEISSFINAAALNPDVDEKAASRKAAARAKAAAPRLNEYVDAVIKEEGIDPSRVILAGFSQGATMAFYAGMMRNDLGGIFSQSGGALDQLKDPKSKTPVMLAVGDQEKGEYLGVSQALKTQRQLEQKGIKADCVVLPDQGHAFTQQSMEQLANFACQTMKNAPQKKNVPSPKQKAPQAPKNKPNLKI